MHEFHEDLVLFDHLLLDDLDRALHLRLDVQCADHFAERALSQRLEQPVVLRDVLDPLEPFEVLERQQFAGCLRVHVRLLARVAGRVVAFGATVLEHVLGGGGVGAGAFHAGVDESAHLCYFYL